jgi:hypothetical protein
MVIDRRYIPLMNSLRTKIALAALLGMAGIAYSHKGGEAQDLKISRIVANDGTFVTLEWNSSPNKVYAVETSIDMKTWTAIVEDLSDPLAPRAYVYPIPDEYVFDHRRFFRVITTTR